MSFFRIFGILLVAILFAGCSQSIPHWHLKAGQLIEAVRADGAPTTLPAEFANLSATYSQGENLLIEEEVEEADEFFRLAYLKAELLRKNLAEERKKQDEINRLKIIEDQRVDAEKRYAMLHEEKMRRIEAELLLARISEEAKREADAEERRQAELRAVQKVKPLEISHTVRRGETLPLISALPEVYGDSQLWPLLYRSNRDQIRDPKNLWPGQVLRIPRNSSREDLAEARRYSMEKRP
jgi:nucleoid-associated protein YgaU